MNRELVKLGEGNVGVVFRTSNKSSTNAPHAIKVFKTGKEHLVSSALRNYRYCREAGLNVPRYFKKVPGKTTIVTQDLSEKGIKSVVTVNSESDTIKKDDFRLNKINSVNGLVEICLRQAKFAADSQIELYPNSYMYAFDKDATSPKVEVFVADFEAVKIDTNVTREQLYEINRRYVFIGLKYLIERVLPYSSEHGRQTDLEELTALETFQAN